MESSSKTEKNSISKSSTNMNDNCSTTVQLSHVGEGQSTTSMNSEMILNYLNSGEQAAANESISKAENHFSDCRQATVNELQKVSNETQEQDAVHVVQAHENVNETNVEIANSSLINLGHIRAATDDLSNDVLSEKARASRITANHMSGGKHEALNRDKLEMNNHSSTDKDHIQTSINEVQQLVAVQQHESDMEIASCSSNYPDSTTAVPCRAFREDEVNVDPYMMLSSDDEISSDDDEDDDDVYLKETINYLRIVVDLFSIDVDKTADDIEEEHDSLHKSFFEAATSPSLNPYHKLAVECLTTDGIQFNSAQRFVSYLSLMYSAVNKAINTMKSNKTSNHLNESSSTVCNEAQCHGIDADEVEENETVDESEKEVASGSTDHVTIADSDSVASRRFKTADICPLITNIIRSAVREETERVDAEVNKVSNGQKHGDTSQSLAAVSEIYKGFTSRVEKMNRTVEQAINRFASRVFRIIKSTEHLHSGVHNNQAIAPDLQMHIVTSTSLDDLTQLQSSEHDPANDVQMEVTVSSTTDTNNTTAEQGTDNGLQIEPAGIVPFYTIGGNAAQELTPEEVAEIYSSQNSGADSQWIIRYEHERRRREAMLAAASYSIHETRKEIEKGVFSDITSKFLEELNFRCDRYAMELEMRAYQEDLHLQCELFESMISYFLKLEHTATDRMRQLKDILMYRLLPNLQNVHIDLRIYVEKSNIVPELLQKKLRDLVRVIADMETNMESFEKEFLRFLARFDEVLNAAFDPGYRSKNFDTLISILNELRRLFQNRYFVVLQLAKFVKKKTQKIAKMIDVHRRQVIVRPDVDSEVDVETT